MRRQQEEGAVACSLPDCDKSEFDAERFLAIPLGPYPATVFGRDVGPVDDFLVVARVVHRGSPLMDVSRLPSQLSTAFY